jgi:small GTP-binding protein
MVGDTNVGKTTLFWKYMEGEFLSNKNESVTIIDFKIKEVQIASQPIKLFIWDTAGQEKYRSMISAYFNGCQGVMLVFDLTSPPSYVNATTKWYDIAKSKCPDAIIMLIGNKSDLPTMVNE